MGTLLQSSGLVPPLSQRLGTGMVKIGKDDITYAYAWLRTASWAVIIQWAEGAAGAPIFAHQLSIMAFSAAIFLVVLSIIVIRSKKLVLLQIEKETTKAQFEHAAKLASVGELSAGVAHEINNPLAVISEEAGLIKDLMSPEFGENITFEEIVPHLENIHESVFRCRDITRKLLSFVRKTDIKLMPHNVNDLIDEVVDAFWIREMAVSNIEIVKNYQPDIPKLVTDANQLKQVFLNILTNAVDAITPPGEISITTSFTDAHISVAIADTGKGITQEQMEKIFMPFYTTKEVGKGTGLGLSVSYNIVRSFGGEILVESIPGKGSVFTVVFPLS
jgi:two-component system NtrC family sensor kinase